jgi:hypothetical protein
MRVRSSPADLLLSLPRQPRLEDQLANFRQALSALAASAGHLGPPPLDGVDPRGLEAAAYVALERGLCESLDFLESGSAAVALYELSSACPAGPVRRDLRRRVFSLMYAGHAGAFLPVATRMALGAAGPLETPTLRARVALCLDFPFGSEQNAAPLALALVTRSATRDAWLIKPARGALPARRLAAQLLEHAALEAVTRYQLGDPQPLSLLLSREVRSPFLRLVFDREPLVWRHAAVARGLLASISRETRQEVEGALGPERSVTDWRRGLVSLVSAMVLGDQEVHSSVHAVLGGPLARRDSGLAAVVPLGLGRVIEAEPDRAENVLDRLCANANVSVALAVAELCEQVKNPDFGKKARGTMRTVLVSASNEQNPVERAFAERALGVLSGEIIASPGLPERVQRALLAFETEGAELAHQLALSASAEAHELAEFIETSDLGDAEARSALLSSLLAIDRAAFQRSTFSQLLLLGRRPGDADGTVEPMERLQNRVSRWILSGLDPALERAWALEYTAFDGERLKVLLHLLDADRGSASDATGPLVNRLQQSITRLLERLEFGVDPSVHRVLCAALARSFDAAVREGVMQVGDLVLVVAAMLRDADAVSTIAEASTSPDVAVPLSALAAFLGPDKVDVFADDANLLRGQHSDGRAASEESLAKLEVAMRLMQLSQGIVGGGGYHAEALRRVIFRLAGTLEAISVARGQAELVDAREAKGPVLEELEQACEDLAHMLRCAQRRVLGGPPDRPSSDYGGPGLRAMVEHGLTTDDAPTIDRILAATESLVVGLPESIGEAIQQVALRIHTLPRTGRSSVRPVPLKERRAPLPNWLLPRRTIGAFYVVRPLGTGGVSSVFIARRYDERNDPQAESFALKVPEYDPSTARSMSEQDFFDMFREEGGALLSLPAHPNLARFVTFDLGARPKPILVMELILGTALDRLLRSRSMTMQRVVSYLDGILAGLEAMHEVGVGHLDIKPTNVILRAGTTPVLVDFGLSGRHLRPGCGTVEYTAPEVLGVFPEDYQPIPPPADMYSIGCLAFELVTGTLLFEAADEMALVTRHVSHDGWLPELAAMNEVKDLGRLARTIAACLRHDPRDRLSAREARERFAIALEPVENQAWPIQVPAVARLGKSG